MFGIAKNGKLPPWRHLIPNDINRFYRMTKNHTMVMGSDTFFSLPMNKRPFPEKDRVSIVVTREPNAQKFDKFRNISNMKIVTLETLQEIVQSDWVFIGGARLFKELKSWISEIDLTVVKSNFECERFIDVSDYAVDSIIEDCPNYSIFLLKKKTF